MLEDSKKLENFAYGKSNPFTALGFLDIMFTENHRCAVFNAAYS